MGLGGRLGLGHGSGVGSGRSRRGKRTGERTDEQTRAKRRRQARQPGNRQGHHRSSQTANRRAPRNDAHRRHTTPCSPPAPTNHASTNDSCSLSVNSPACLTCLTPDYLATAPPRHTHTATPGHTTTQIYMAGRGRGPARSGGPPSSLSPGGKPRKHPKAGRRPVALRGETHRAKQMEGNTRRETGVPSASAPLFPGASFDATRPLH
jgi:hypothetical protein